MKVALVITLCLCIIGTAQATPRPSSPAEQWAQTGFARCVRWRESTDGKGAQNLYQIQGPKATPTNGDYHWLDGTSRKHQNLIAYNMFLSRGDSPWKPYDHCYSGMYYPHNGY